jgi:hypothetical protein
VTENRAEVDLGYLWNLTLGRIEPSRATCAVCGKAMVHSSDWWVDAEDYTPQCGLGPAWTGHYPSGAA